MCAEWIVGPVNSAHMHVPNGGRGRALLLRVIAGSPG